MENLNKRVEDMIEHNSRDNAELAHEKYRFLDRMIINIIADFSIDPQPEHKQRMIDLLNDIKMDYLAFIDDKDKMPWEK